MIKKLYTSLGLSLLTLPGFSSAQLTVPNPNPGGFGGKSTLGGIISYLVQVAIMLAGIVFLVMLIVGGFQYFASSGDQALAQKANRTMLNAGIGLIIVAIAYAVAAFITSLLGINNGLFN